MYVIFGILLLILGWVGNSAYHEYTNHRFLNGLHFSNVSTQSEAIQHSQNMEGGGNWVCVNVKGMEYKTAIQTCEHETAHEIFAVECSKNISKCMEEIGK